MNPNKPASICACRLAASTGGFQVSAWGKSRLLNLFKQPLAQTLRHFQLIEIPAFEAQHVGHPLSIYSIKEKRKASFQILDLLAHLLNQQFQLHCRLRNFTDDRF